MTKKFQISPLFFVLALVLTLTGRIVLFVSYMGAMVFHELAHIIVSERKGYSLKSFRLSIFGASANIEGGYFTALDQISISFAGPVCNFLIASTFMSLWWICPSLIEYTKLFVASNLVLACINLMPAMPLDGGRIVNAILQSKYSNEKSSKIMKILNSLLFLIFIIIYLFAKNKSANITILIFAIFLFFGIFFQNNISNYFYITLLKKQRKNNFNKIKCVAIASNLPIYKVYSKLSFNKLNIIYIKFPNNKIKQINEFQLHDISEKYPATTTFDELIK